MVVKLSGIHGVGGVFKGCYRNKQVGHGGSHETKVESVDMSEEALFIKENYMGIPRGYTAINQSTGREMTEADYIAFMNSDEGMAFDIVPKG